MKRFVLLLCISASGVWANTCDTSAALSWLASTTPSVTYNVYRGLNGGALTKINGSAVSATNYTDSTIADGVVYDYAVTAVDGSSNESGYSNIVTAVVPGCGGSGTPQAAAWPGHVATNADLLQAANTATSTLSAPITGTTTAAFTVASASSFVVDQVVTIDQEEMELCTIASTTFTPCSRGFAGTTPATHLSGKNVDGRISAVYHNQIAQEIIAIETWLTTATHHGTYPGTASGGASWPNHVATNAELFQEADGSFSATGTVVGSSDTTIPLTDASSFRANQLAMIDSELIEIGTVSGGNLTGCTRGVGGTTASSHSVGAIVSGVIAAYNHNRLALELAAIEADLYGNAGSTQMSVCGTGCSTVGGASWPNHAATLSDLLVAAANGSVDASYHNRLVTELIELEADLNAHP